MKEPRGPKWICDCTCDCKAMVEFKQRDDREPDIDILCDDCWEGEHTYTDAGQDNYGDARYEEAP